jgi:hypothetical protein
MGGNHLEIVPLGFQIIALETPYKSKRYKQDYMDYNPKIIRVSQQYVVCLG